MKKVMTVVLLGMIAMNTGCAKYSSRIEPVKVNDEQFLVIPCDELEDALKQKEQETKTATNIQDARATGDVLAIIQPATWVLIAMNGDDEPEVAELKGYLMAMTSAYQKHCDSDYVIMFDRPEEDQPEPELLNEWKW